MPIITAGLTEAQVLAQLAFARPEIRAAFLRTVTSMVDATTLTELTRLVEQGRGLEAILMADKAVQPLATAVNGAYISGADRVSRWIGSNLDSIIHFDAVNTRAVAAMQSTQHRIGVGFSREQAAATRQAITEGIRSGAGPRAIAVSIRDSIGLTRYQEQIVRNYRTALETGDHGNALGRELRDARSDRSVLRAVREDRVLPKAQIDAMVGRYRENWLNFRAETIGRTEALRAAHAGMDEGFRQAVANGELEREEIVRTWKHTDAGKNARDFHETMDGDEAGLGESFISGRGVSLRYPGDPDAPADETVNCRCVVVTRIRLGRKAA